jgi:hypothetical protein
MAESGSQAGLEKLHLTWEDIESMCNDIHAQVQSKGIKPDIIMGVSRGGLIPARILSSLFKNKNLSTIRVTFYTKPGVTKPYPRLAEDSAADVNGKTLLIVDDVIETGKTLDLAKRHFNDKGAKKIYIAVLLKKDREMLLQPDFHSRMTDKWVVYPWERFDD